MPEGKIARPEGTKCPSSALLPEAIYNYVLTVEEYVFSLSEGKKPENCERARKSAQNYANDFFCHSCLLIIHFSFMPCREKTCVKAQNYALLQMCFIPDKQQLVLHLEVYSKCVSQLNHKISRCDM